ncbi:hypothetical protein FQN54_009334 [Arachnomyces sp. PD_36]|nr:hypothetical protein FQN54_009334 [Arachnomyces sp. PD_36]
MVLRLFGMVSPATGPVNKHTCYDYLGPDLNYVTRKLESDPSVRDFSFNRNELRSRAETPPSPQTPLYPHPMYPLEYWRTWAQRKRENYIQMRFKLGLSNFGDPRDSIVDIGYWRCEAHFWESKAKRENRNRYEISNADYWRCEADFWKTAWTSKRDEADRTEIEDPEYWHCESKFWMSICNSVGVGNTTRDQIEDPEYWKCENTHFNNVLEPLLQHSLPLFTTSAYVAVPDACNEKGLQIKYVPV